MTAFPSDSREYVLQEQYKTDANLAARQSIYRFRQPKGDLYESALALADLRGDETVVDIGCGNGGYLATLARLAHAGTTIGLDLSPGMLVAARPRAENASLALADAEALPVATGAADVALAMHMLYHVPDRARAIRELRRVTKPGGRVLVVTNAASHMRELDDLITRITGRRLPGSTVKFKMETGASELRAAFDGVERHDFPGELVVTDPEAVVD